MFDYGEAQDVYYMAMQFVEGDSLAQCLVLPTAPFRAILTDFGLARLVSGGHGNTATGVLGTLSYIAPEQIAASGDVGPAADIYALGVMAYQMFTGELPFTGDNPGAILMGHLQKPAPDPRQAAPGLPKHAAFAILNALAKEPDERYTTAGEFVQALAGKQAVAVV